jgi:hypothetical protein
MSSDGNIKEWKDCKNVRDNYRVYLPCGPGTKQERTLIVEALIQTIWVARFIIRYESHDVPEGKDGDKDELYNDNTIPPAWLKHSSAGDILMMRDQPLAEQDAIMTDMTTRLERHANRKKSSTLTDICDAAWAKLMSLDKASTPVYEHYKVVGDVSALRRIITFCLDAFEFQGPEPTDIEINTRLVNDLRILITYYIGSPITDFCKSWNANIKKRVFQWYTSRTRDAADVGRPSDGHNGLFLSWKRMMTRTPAQKKIGVLLEARRHYQRSQGPLYVSANRVEGLVRESLTSEFWAKCCAILCCAGMRANELFRPMIDFAACDDGRENSHLWFKQIGTSKQENANEMQLQSQPIQASQLRTAMKPICWGVNWETLKEAIMDVRMVAWNNMGISEGIDFSADLIARIFIPKLSATMHAIFDLEAIDAQSKYSAFGTSWARKLYAAAAPLQFPVSAAAMTIPAFVSEILMHSPGIPKTSVFYACISFEEPSSDGQERKKRKSQDDQDGRPKKKKKRKNIPVPQPSAPWAKSDITVELMTKNGEKIMVNRWNHGRFKTQEARMQYYDEVTSYLTSLNVRPSIYNLKAVGVSQKFQRDRKKQRKQDDTSVSSQLKVCEMIEKMNKVLEDETSGDEGSADSSDGDDDTTADEEEFEATPPKRKKTSKKKSPVEIAHEEEGTYLKWKKTDEKITADLNAIKERRLLEQLAAEIKQ